MFIKHGDGKIISIIKSEEQLEDYLKKNNSSLEKEKDKKENSNKLEK